MAGKGDESGSAGISALYQSDRRYFDKSHGFAEILVQHAPHDTGLLKYPGLELDLESKRIKKAIDLVLIRKAPVTLHLELNDAEGNSVHVLRQLNDLLERHPERNFVLIHLAQATAAEARKLIEKHVNIHFLTSTADVFAVIGGRVLRARKHSAQTGWINLFDDPPAKAPYRGWLGDYLRDMRWRDEWRELIEEHPGRFVFAMDNVFGPHWTKRYGLKLKIWRWALSMLSPETAGQVACLNAKRLWRLDFDCLS